MENSVSILLLDPRAIVPKRYDGIGYDLSALEGGDISPGEIKIFRTGISMAIHDQTCYGRIAPRSGLAVRKGIDVLAGVVDASYRGEIMVVLVNHGKETAHFNPEDRIAQLIFEQARLPSVSVVQTVEELGFTSRSNGGFGSTGV